MRQPAEEHIPESVKRFIIERINSVESLEILLVLFDQPTAESTALDMSRQLRTSVESAAARLDELRAAKLLLASGEPAKFRFNPAHPESQVVADLERIYKERRVSVISLIYSKPSEPLRAFSDAFRLRKGES